MRISLKPPDRVLAAELQTERFTLRPLGAFELMRDPFGWRRNPEIYRNLYLRRQPLSLADWLRMGPIPDQQVRFTYAIVPKGGSEVIGLHSIRRNGWRTATSTVGIHAPEWLGKHVVVEVRARLMNHFFRHGRIERFNARIEASNHGSVFTYRKLGYAHVGTLHRERPDPHTGAPLDFLLFEMLKEDWMRSRYAEPDL